MRLQSFILLLVQTTSTFGSPPFKSSAVPKALISAYLDVETLASEALERTREALTKRGRADKPDTNSCTLGRLKTRKEWNSLTDLERIAYTDAVNCLLSKPANTPTSLVPGARSRFDDFVASHINQTMTIHYTGSFLSWHRYYTWLYEEALRKECGYNGTQPYWDWALTAQNGMDTSAIFDGSATSMSGNGAFIAKKPDVILGPELGFDPLYMPAGTGGGCVTSGPFKGMRVNLGPVSLNEYGGDLGVNPGGPFAYNPRCLRRDISTKVNLRFANASSILDLLLKSKSIDRFQSGMQGELSSGEVGVHGGGHYALGGDPGRDFYTSPGDPAFYLHHGMIDRVWWIWQMMNPEDRVSGDGVLAGTNTFLDNPPSPKTTREDVIDLGHAGGPPKKIGELLSVVDGPFCYVYA
ncbi:hypothetical protein OQA88_5929 [Cercophora sp. LCS_1]